MRLITGVHQLTTSLTGSLVALGNFDGLHLGHQSLIHRLVKEARLEKVPAVVFTFSPHPVEILHPEKKHQSLFSREDLRSGLDHLGVDILIIEPFHAQLSLVSAEAFIENYLVKKLHPRKIVVGHDFGFGAGREGTTDLLLHLGRQFNFSVIVLEPILHQGERVSSSLIRKEIKAGHMDRVHELLGRPFALHGKVVHGAGRGHHLGFPTANLSPTDCVLPKNGVYVTRASLGGQAFPSVTNVGVAPTFQTKVHLPRVETYILDQNLSLVGSPMTVEFLSYLREELRFSGQDELVNQIRHDVQAARNWWKNFAQVGCSWS